MRVTSTCQLEPFAMIFGNVGTSTCQYILYIERQFIFEQNTFMDVVLDVFGSYYILDISYQKQLLSILYFIEQFIFQVRKVERQKFPEPLNNFIRLSQSVTL